MHIYDVGSRLDPDQVQIEEGVEVGTQQKPVRWVVGRPTAARADVSGFQKFQQPTTTYQTAITVPSPESVPKRSLPTTFSNLPSYNSPPVTVRRNSRSLVVNGRW